MKRVCAFAMISVAMGLAGCGPARVDFSEMQKPAPGAELDNLKQFVGDWAWEAERTVPDGEPENWSGTANWSWVLDAMYLRGEMTSSGEGKRFSSIGYWGWHPKRRTYVWWMLNDWGYPQEGNASYDAEQKLWTMNYEGIGLDGTSSYGRYTIRVVDDNTLEWNLVEWADMLRCCFKKIQMTGIYKRK